MSEQRGVNKRTAAEPSRSSASQAPRRQRTKGAGDPYRQPARKPTKRTRSAASSQPRGDVPTVRRKPDKPAKPTKRKRSSGKSQSTNAAVARRSTSRPAQQKAVSQPEAASRKQAPESATTLIGRLMPVLCTVIAFVAVVILYKRMFPQVDTGEQSQESQAQEVVATGDDVSTYAGVRSPWTMSGSFTMGDEKLDEQVKAFCDVLSDERLTAGENAQKVYNKIALESTYEFRDENEKPAGRDWAMAAARHYFSTGSPEDGVCGKGDYYEYSAVISYCLKYLGFGDAQAIPVVITDAAGEETGSAYVLVTNENGYKSLCDPSRGADGYMNDRYSYTILVENIGQDLTSVESLGLEIKKDETEEPEEDGVLMENGVPVGEVTPEGYTSHTTGTGATTGTATGTTTGGATGTTVGV